MVTQVKVPRSFSERASIAAFYVQNTKYAETEPPEPPMLPAFSSRGVSPKLSPKLATPLKAPSAVPTSPSQDGSLERLSEPSFLKSKIATFARTWIPFIALISFITLISSIALTSMFSADIPSGRQLPVSGAVALEPSPPSPPPPPPPLTNWAVAKLGAEILGTTRLGPESWLDKYIGPAMPLEQLITPSDQPTFCATITEGSKIVLSLSKRVDIRKVVLHTKLGEVGGALSVWDGNNFSPAVCNQTIESGETIFNLREFSSVLSISLQGLGCIYGVQVWGY